jgi:cytochrome c-type biogenesis protein CcmH
MIRRALPWIALAVVALAAIVVLVADSEPDSSASARSTRLYHEIACPVCDGQSIADSNAPEARQMRAAIVRDLEAGKSTQQIKDAFVQAYGERVLLTPSDSGIGIVAWAIPAAVLVLGGAGILIALRRWSRTPRLTATAEDEVVVRRAREQGAREQDAHDEGVS